MTSSKLHDTPILHNGKDSSTTVFVSEEIFFDDLHEDHHYRGRLKTSSMRESYLFHLYCRVLYLLACLIWLRALSSHLK